LPSLGDSGCLRELLEMAAWFPDIMNNNLIKVLRPEKELPDKRGVRDGNREILKLKVSH